MPSSRVPFPPPRLPFTHTHPNRMPPRAPVLNSGSKAGQLQILLQYNTTVPVQVAPSTRHTDAVSLDSNEGQEHGYGVAGDGRAMAGQTFLGGNGMLCCYLDVTFILSVCGVGSLPNLIA